MRAISLVFNLVFLTFIKFKPHFNSAINFIYSFNAIPTSIYLLILAALLISGLLLENQLITIGSKGQMFFYIINKYLAAICITLLTIVIVNLLITCITKSYYQNTSSLLEKQINMQLDYYNKLEAKNEELRAFRHDYKNHMLCLQSLIKNNDVESAAEYLQKITNRSYSEAQPYFTGNKIADAILSDKSSAAEKCDTRIIFQGEIFDEIPPADICVILSNALDNAIEASEKISSPDKVIKVSCIFSKNVQIINISNPIDTDTAITDGHIHTSKLDTDNHGFGLYNIKSTVDKYSGDFNINCENGRFVLEIGINVAEYSLNRKIK